MPAPPSTTPEDLSPLPPALGRYQPLAPIGQGGMAEVLLAEMNLGNGVTKLAVLKRLWPELAADPEMLSMFLREARLGARMNHPNIVQTYDVLPDRERPAIALEYLDGQPLTRVLNRLVGSGVLSWSLRLKIIADVLDGLAYAHGLKGYDGSRQGVVHRDVNPQNVFVTYNGEVKIVDFGVAKSIARGYRTQPKSVTGKLGYMAPEQLDGAIDRRTDLFAVGIVLWEMAARRRLWRGVAEGAIIRNLTSGVPIPPLPDDPTRPSDLTAICGRAVALDPQKRYQSAAEFAADIERLIPGGPISRGRHLGKVVSFAFAEERSARQALIQSYLRRAQRAERPGPGPGAAAAEPAPSIWQARPTPGGLWTVDEPTPAGPTSVFQRPPRKLLPAETLRTMPAVSVPRGGQWARRAFLAGAVVLLAAAAVVGTAAFLSTARRPLVAVPAVVAPSRSSIVLAPIVRPSEFPSADSSSASPPAALAAPPQPGGESGDLAGRRIARPRNIAFPRRDLAPLHRSSPRPGPSPEGQPDEAFSSLGADRIPPINPRSPGDDDILRPSVDLSGVGAAPAPARSPESARRPAQRRRDAPDPFD